MSFLDWLKGSKAGAGEHYIFTCIACEFSHHVPRDCSIVEGGAPLEYSVDVSAARMTCIYGPAGHPNRFTVSLQVGDFFSARKVPESSQVLHASIADNMKLLHRHILSHCDPVFLIVRQTDNSTSHVYKRSPEGQTYVKCSANHGTDIVGKINVSRAEIPGVSW
jgi:hypothetical protein